ncbi:MULTISPECIES: protocatechuate 3,4-dioxygenase [Ramlibacter]|uniref:dioxygenase family protein n=1 Tax=Ramlibacter TaxID=174951 RepID=UPI0015EFD4CC|nr:MULTISPECIES: protocatechuate 3,4-dioxygenase [Ramlibacter]MBA2963878.1 intradiol ring-cleavage dioxygenase [Ramlibacter sp. CGMCC 1.13660]
MPVHRPLTRRAATAALVALPVLHLGVRAQAPRRPTPAQTEGPFYPVQLPADTDHDLLRNGNASYAGGQPAWVAGTVSDVQGRPLAGAAVEIWQCDGDGHYHHPGDGGRADPAFQGFGRVLADREGQWRFRTIRPVAYSGRTPHIHVKVRLGSRELLTTQLYVQGDPHNESDGLWRRLSAADREALTVPFRAGADGLQASFPIVVAA